ncbi:MAG: hypothetical protein ACFFG0_11420 [Candidatus Thorarchaeota archaeon]
MDRYMLNKYSLIEGEELKIGFNGIVNDKKNSFIGYIYFTDQRAIITGYRKTKGAAGSLLVGGWIGYSITKSKVSKQLKKDLSKVDN